MLRKLLYLLLPLALGACSKVEQQANDAPASETARTTAINIVPYPQSVTVHKGEMRLGSAVTVTTATEAPDSADALFALLDQLGIQYREDDNAVISLELNPKSQTGQEGYQLSIDDQRIVIRATTDTGLYYGVQSLRQLLPASAQAEYVLPQLLISDQPQYSWRGSMLDVARNLLVWITLNSIFSVWRRLS